MQIENIIIQWLKLFFEFVEFCFESSARSFIIKNARKKISWLLRGYVIHFIQLIFSVNYH